MTFKTLASTSLAVLVFALASCAPTQKDPYDTGNLYGYPDAGLESSPDGSLYDVPADYEDGGAANPTTNTITYTVQRGDTLSKISKRHNVSMRSIIDANNISNPNLLRVGQMLSIPGN
ncbi:MAG: LysM peptidoglycan-binding domain-containing protein [Luteolibacter sp.]|jgi:nucleoid-associated protein YgaU